MPPSCAVIEDRERRPDAIDYFGRLSLGTPELKNSRPKFPQT